MEKREFLKELQNRLNSLPSDEQNEILQDIEEHFNVGLEEGKTETQIADSLGSPHQLAKDIKANYHVEKAKEHTSTENVFKATLAVIALGFLNLIIVLGPLLAVAGIIVSLWGISVSFILQFVAFIGKMIITPDAFQLFELFFSITIVGIGLFLGVAMYYVTKYAIKIFIKYLNYNVRIVKGGATND